MDFLKDKFSSVVGVAALFETCGENEKMSRDYFSCASQVEMLSNHTKLVATNPQYSDLYKAFIKTTFEKSDYASGHVQSICGASMEDEYAVSKAYDDYQADLGMNIDALDAKYAQQENALFTIYKKAYSP